MRRILLTISLLALTAAGCNSVSFQPGPSGRACTQEAMLCADGSAVGRTGPNCEFAKCPAGKVKEPKACSEDAKVCPGGGTVMRTGPNCEFAACPTGANVPKQPHYCSLDAKVCSDGSSVGRIPPSCEFAKCPGKK